MVVTLYGGSVMTIEEPLRFVSAPAETG